MIDRDYFSRTGDLRERPGIMVDGIEVVRLARGIVRSHIAYTSEEDRGVYVKRGLRQYRLEEERGFIRIEGLILPPPPSETKASVLERLGDVKALTPVTINPAGIIESEGGRISPHDERLAILATDLSRPVIISSASYYSDSAKRVR